LQLIVAKGRRAWTFLDHFMVTVLKSIRNVTDVLKILALAEWLSLNAEVFNACSAHTASPFETRRLGVAPSRM
jgi:hypothetical protein